MTDEERDARLRGKVYAALTTNTRVVRTLLGRRALDAPEMEAIAAIAVAALRDELEAGR